MDYMLQEELYEHIPKLQSIQNKVSNYTLDELADLTDGEENSEIADFFKFNDETNDVVNNFNKGLSNEGKLSTNPYILDYFSYDCYDIVKNETPVYSLCCFTVNGLKYIFPKIKIELRNDHEIFVEGELMKFSAIPDMDNHIDYIKKIMMDIFCLYQKDETKIPPSMYGWYFNNIVK